MVTPQISAFCKEGIVTRFPAHSLLLHFWFCLQSSVTFSDTNEFSKLLETLDFENVLNEDQRQQQLVQILW